MSSRSARHQGKQWNYINIKLCSGTTSKRDRICAKAPIFRHQLTIFFPFFLPFPFFYFFCFISLSILLPACAGGKWRERDNSIQKQKWKCRTRRHSALSWSAGRMHPAAAGSPQRLTELILCSPGNLPSSPGDISLVYKWDLLIFCDFPGLSYALPALQSGFASFPAHAQPPTHACTSLLVSFQMALSASHNFCSLQFRSLLNETHAGLSNHNVIYNLPQNTFIQLVAHWRKRTPYELAAEALIWLFPHENPSRGACKRGLRGEGKSESWPQLTLIINANR